MGLASYRAAPRRFKIVGGWFAWLKANIPAPAVNTTGYVTAYAIRASTTFKSAPRNHPIRKDRDLKPLTSASRRMPRKPASVLDRPPSRFIAQRLRTVFRRSSVLWEDRGSSRSNSFSGTARGHHAQAFARRDHHPCNGHQTRSGNPAVIGSGCRRYEPSCRGECALPATSQQRALVRLN
jgi:hypothetical protein